MAALDGIRVLDLGQFYFGPYCSMLLARMGADVVKIEAPDGDPYRRLPTAGEDGVSFQFQMLNSGKRLIRLDLKNPAGREVLLKLVRESDVLVQNLSPGAMDRFGLSYDQLRAENPQLVMATGSGFGSFGPYAGEAAMDLSVQARTAVMSTTGFDEGPPLRTGPSVVDFMGGTHLVAGVLGALFQRERTGEGQHIEVSLQDAVLPSLTSNIAGWVNSDGGMPERTGNRNGGLAVTPYNSYRTQDGWIALLCPTDPHWRRLCALMKDPEAGAARFDAMAARCADMDEVDQLVERWTRKHRKDDLKKWLDEAKIPAAPVVTLPELMVDPHIQARQVLRNMHDDEGAWVTWGSPIFMSASPLIEPTRPGQLGADTDTVLREDLGMAEAEIAALRENGAI